MFLDTDREVCDFRRICHATNAAVETYRCGVWRDRYARRYDMPPAKLGGQRISMTYKIRSKLLRKSAKFVVGQQPREIRCMEILRDLIVGERSHGYRQLNYCAKVLRESYADLPIGHKATRPSNNLREIERFVQRSGFLRKLFFSLDENSNINPILQTLQLVLTHLQLSIGSAKANPPLGLAYSQFAVYSHPDDLPMFNTGDKWQVSMNLLLHIANFWKNHMTRKDESTLYELFSRLQEHERPKAWKSRLVQGDDGGGVQILGRHWKGTYGKWISVVWGTARSGPV